MIKTSVAEHIKNEFDDSGFSLVELIIVVSILAIAAVPLMKSMGMATKVNVKAQSIQNATSLAESVMENVKATPVSDIVAAHGGSFSGDEYTYIESGVTATQGEEFDVKVTIDRKSYGESVPEPDPDDPDPALPSKAEKVKAANITKLPAIEEIDTMTQAVLTSSKEFNRYDEAAQRFFNEKKAGYKPEDPTTNAVIASKVITINKECGIEGGYEVVRVTAKVRYEGKEKSTDSELIPIGFERDLYNGAFSSPESISAGGYSPDSNIYMFYSRNTKLPSEVHDVINIIDKGNVSNPETAFDSHRVYLIMQKQTDPVPKIKIKREGTSTEYDLNTTDLTDGDIKIGIDPEDPDHPDKTKVAELITNISSHIYREEAKTRVYKVTVVLTKGDEDPTEYARLESTITASDETP